MTDLERLLEQVREHEHRAGVGGLSVARWITGEAERWRTDPVVNAKRAAHHALTALALRDLLDPTPVTIPTKVPFTPDDSR